MSSSNSEARKRHEEMVSAAREVLFAEVRAGADKHTAATKFVERVNAAKVAETTIIGLSGWAQSGKDSTGNVMESDFRFERLSFADALRTMAEKANPTIVWNPDVPMSQSPDWDAREALNLHGYEFVKQNSNYRLFLQSLGTAVREVLGADTWVNTCMDRIVSGNDYVITDVRFKNEANAIKARGGEVWRIQRAGHKAANEHISEHDLDDYAFDRKLSLPDFGDNLEELYPAIKGLLAASLGLVSQ